MNTKTIYLPAAWLVGLVSLRDGEENKFGTQRPVSFHNPDFNFSQFRSNLVLRWEYLPGSQIYLVWSNERTYFKNPSGRSVSDAMSSLKDVYPTSIFLLKFNYWFTI